MRTRATPVIVIALLLAASLGNAQDAPSGSGGDIDSEATALADLALIQGRIAKRPQFEGLLDRMRREVDRGGMSIFEFLNQMYGGRRRIESDGFPYRLETQIIDAEQRAERYASIISSDLDGDGSVTRAEIAAKLTSTQRGRQGAAEALISFDADNNNTLSPAEISLAVRDDGQARNGGNTEYMFGEVMDLDDDGVLTLKEIARVEAAFRHWEEE